MPRSFWDISMPLQPGIPIWPQSSGFEVQRVLELSAGAPVNESHLSANAHVGTHIDAPLHFLPDGASVDALPLDSLVGPATVALLPGLAQVSAAGLEALGLPPATKRLLLRTDNASRWHDTAFAEDYVSLTPDAARWLVDHEIALVGVDYLSVERYGGDGEVHRILLGAGIVVVEGLNLEEVPAGDYWLACLPLRLVGAEAAPARAVLMSMEAAA
jgi:arylformamidase